MDSKRVNDSSQPPARKKRRMTKAAKRAYARAAAIGVVGVMAISLTVFGATKLLGNSLDTNRQGNAAPIPEPPVVETMASSTVKALTGTELSSVLEPRLTNLSATVPVPQTTALNIENVASTGSNITIPTEFKPEDVGTSGKGNIPAWKEVNSDVVGWLKVPNTNINFPVVVGPDNLYYNTLGYYKEYSRNGVIWADSDTKFGTSSQISRNNVLYGHNWANISANPRIGSSADVMFGQLPAFHHLSFAQVTPYIHYSTESEAMLWKVFAVFYTEESFNYIVSDPSDAKFQSILDEAKLRSRHNYAVEVTTSDKILTLSTCTRAYGSTSEQRFVVMARLMREGEEIEAVTITANPNHKQPVL